MKLIHTFRFVLNEEIHSMKSSSLLSSLLTRTISSGGAAGCPCTNYFLRKTTLKSKLTFLQGYIWKSLEHPSKFVTFFKSCAHIIITEKDDTKVFAENITIFKCKGYIPSNTEFIDRILPYDYHSEADSESSFRLVVRSKTTHNVHTYYSSMDFQHEGRILYLRESLTKSGMALFNCHHSSFYNRQHVLWNGYLPFCISEYQCSSGPYLKLKQDSPSCPPNTILHKFPYFPPLYAMLLDPQVGIT